MFLLLSCEKEMAIYDNVFLPEFRAQIHSAHLNDSKVTIYFIFTN